MKMLVVLISAILAVAFGLAVGQVPFDQYPDFARQGKLLTAATTDTFHFEDTQVAEVADWQGKETIYVPQRGSMVQKQAFVIGVVLYARLPFTYAATYRNGDAGGTVAVDTIPNPGIYQTAAADSVKTVSKFPCQAVVLGDLDEVIATPGSENIVYGIPLLDYE